MAQVNVTIKIKNIYVDLKLTSSKWRKLGARSAHVIMNNLNTQHAGIAQWLERRTSWLKGRGFAADPCRSGGRLFFFRVDFLCWLLFRYPFHPRVTAVARKRSRSFCQKCRWHVTAKHSYTLRMWLCMKWHGAWLYGALTQNLRRDGCSFMWHQPCRQRCGCVKKKKKKSYKKASHSCRTTWVCSRERRIELYKWSSISK